MSDIIEPTNSNGYEVVRLCAILKLTHYNYKSIFNSLIQSFDDVEWNDTEKSLYIRQLVHSFIPDFRIKNIDMVKLIIDELKKYLEIADITIIEQRLPIEEVRYKLES